MYIPKPFHEEDIHTLHQLMQEYNFATMISFQDSMPVVTHLPLIVEPEYGSYGRLMGHLARANTQWQSFDGVQEALVIFQGPHAYISPAWYETKPSVPTWNYAVVHAYGVPRVISDQSILSPMLRKLVEKHEAAFEHPWAYGQLPEDYLQRMMQGIVGFEMEITRLEGKFKLSQNRSSIDQTNVIAALRQNTDALSTGTAELMERNRKRHNSQ